MCRLIIVKLENTKDKEKLSKSAREGKKQVTIYSKEISRLAADFQQQLWEPE